MNMDTTTGGQGNSTSAGATSPGVARRHNRHLTAAVVLIVIRVVFLAENIIPEFSFADYWPLLLIAIGATFLWRARGSA